MAAKPPAPLLAAIRQAVKGTPVTVATMVGIWRIESASTFPNPAVNKEGYGGLFGTTDWNGSTQAQAKLAVSILANLIQTRGSLPSALLAYSGGGYSSVDGSGGSTQANAGGPPGTPTANTGTPAPPADTQIPTVVPPPQGVFSPDVELPGTQQYTLGQPVVSDLWRQVNQGSFVSPEALMLGQNADAAA